ncbi:MAG: hypothetical protein HYW63_01975 [Candidatus Levybacteria bacterium]|nr:hypothetical protein [Candidatus Levybacteria bacterium]
MQLVKINKFNFLILISAFLLFFAIGTLFLDPDFGWHMKMGELMLAKGIPKNDPFSYTMPSYPFVDHEWLTDIILYLIYQNIGYASLAVLFGLIAVLSILIMFRSRQDQSYFLVPFILGAGSLLPSSGVRPQVISWLFFSILVSFFFDEKIYKRLRIFLPVFFLAWANLHGGFAIGIFTLATFIFFKFLKDKKINFIDIWVVIFCALATLINPYGINLWKEIYMSASDSSLRWGIQEWAPAFFFFNVPLITLVCLSAFLVIRFRKNFGLFEKALYLGLLLAGLSSVRHMPFFVLVSLPLLSKSIGFLGKEAERVKYGRQRFKKAYTFMVALSIFTVIVPLVSGKDLLFSRQSAYPADALGYLKRNPGSGNLFSEYGWGGYLIWRYPEKKVFIDGRMPSWRWQADIKNESNYAFKEYKDLMNGKSKLSYAINKYNIDTFLLPVQVKKELSYPELLFERLENKIFRKEKYDNIYIQLEREGWNVVYQDKVAIVYRKSRL